MIIFYHAFFFFLIIVSYLLIPSVITQIFNLIRELVIPIGIPTKEAKAEMETCPVTVEFEISDPKLYELFYASNSLTHFDLHFQLNNFIFHLYFSV